MLSIFPNFSFGWWSKIWLTFVLFCEPKCSPKSDTNCNISVLDEHKESSDVAELKRDALKRPLYLFHATPLIFLLRLQFLFFQRKKRTIGVKVFTVLMLGSSLNHLARVQLKFRPGFNFLVRKYGDFFCSVMKWSYGSCVPWTGRTSCTVRPGIPELALVSCTSLRFFVRLNC